MMLPLGTTYLAQPGLNPAGNNLSCVRLIFVLSSHLKSVCLLHGIASSLEAHDLREVSLWKEGVGWGWDPELPRAGHRWSQPSHRAQQSLSGELGVPLWKHLQKRGKKLNSGKKWGKNPGQSRRIRNSRCWSRGALQPVGRPWWGRWLFPALWPEERSLCWSRFSWWELQPMEKIHPATGKSVRREQQRELFQWTVPIPHPPAWLWVRGKDSGMQE